MIYQQRCGRAHWRCLSGCSGSTHPSDTSGSAAAGSQELEALLSSEHFKEVLRGCVYISVYISHFTNKKTRWSTTFMVLFTGHSLCIMLLTLPCLVMWCSHEHSIGRLLTDALLICDQFCGLQSTTAKSPNWDIVHHQIVKTQTNQLKRCFWKMI